MTSLIGRGGVSHRATEKMPGNLTYQWTDVLKMKFKFLLLTKIKKNKILILFDNYYYFYSMKKTEMRFIFIGNNCNI